MSFNMEHVWWVFWRVHSFEDNDGKPRKGFTKIPFIKVYIKGYNQ